MYTRIRIREFAACMENYQGKWLIFQGRHLCQNSFCLPCVKGSTLKGKNVPLFFPLRVDPFSEEA